MAQRVSAFDLCMRMRFSNANAKLYNYCELNVFYRDRERKKEANIVEKQQQQQRNEVKKKYEKKRK